MPASLSRAVARSGLYASISGSQPELPPRLQDRFLRLKAEGRDGDAPTQIYFPPQVSAFVSAAGGIRSSLLSANPNGSRVLDVIPSGASFSVSVAGGPLDLKGC